MTASNLPDDLSADYSEMKKEQHSRSYVASSPKNACLKSARQNCDSMYFEWEFNANPNLFLDTAPRIQLDGYFMFRWEYHYLSAIPSRIARESWILFVLIWPQFVLLIFFIRLIHWPELLRFWGKPRSGFQLRHQLTVIVRNVFFT